MKEIDEPLNIEVGQRYILDPANYDRYKPWVTAFSSVDKDMLVSVYKRFYPLLEEAYLQQGVDRGTFHNVVLSVIDDLLANGWLTSVRETRSASSGMIGNKDMLKVLRFSASLVFRAWP